MSEDQQRQGHPQPQEPTHPDYGMIREIIASSIDAHIGEDGGFDLVTYAEQFVDTSSVAHIAMERIIGVGLFPFENPQEFQAVYERITLAAMMYVEAFTLGMQFEQAQAGQDKVLAGILRKLLAKDNPYLMGPDFLDVDERTDLTPIEHATLVDFLATVDRGDRGDTGERTED